MLKGGYIYEKKDEWKRGKRLPLSLTPKTHEQVRLNSLTTQYPELIEKRESKIAHSYSKLKKRDQQREDTWEEELIRKKIYYLIICIDSFDTPNKSYKYPGISVNDILNARYDGHAFWYLRLEDYIEMIEECLNLLLKWGVVTRIKTPEKEEPRYESARPDWEDFVKSCLQLMDGAIMHWLHLKWNNIRPPNPLERRYYETVWGKRNADCHLRSVYNNWKNNDSRRMKKADVKYLLECLSVRIYENILKIEEKYHHLSAEHPSLCNSIYETLFPGFLRNEVEKIYRKNVIEEGKEYPKFRMFFTSDVLAFKESVDYNKTKI